MPPVPPAHKTHRPHSSSTWKGESDDDSTEYIEEGDSAAEDHAPQRKVSRGYAKRLDRRKRALARRLHLTHNYSHSELAELYGVRPATMKRAIGNEYALSGRDNLDSDSEHVEAPELRQALDKLWAQAQNRSRSRVSDPILKDKNSKNEEAVPPPAKAKIRQFLISIDFTKSQILETLPRLRDAGIMDDITFSQILTWPECDIDQLLKELEEKKALTMVQRIRIRRGIMEQRDMV